MGSGEDSIEFRDADVVESKGFIDLVKAGDDDGLVKLVHDNPGVRWGPCVSQLSDEDRRWAMKTIGDSA